MMKRNISPPLGYANGSQGKMIGIVPREGNVLPAGAPGEMIMIEPPEYENERRGPDHQCGPIQLRGPIDFGGPKVPLLFFITSRKKDIKPV